MKKSTIIIMSSIVLVLLVVIVILLLTGGKKEITIMFDTDGGSTVSSLKIKEGETAKLPTPTKEDNTFDGWYLDGKKVDNEHIFNEDTLLKAKWKATDEKKYKVTFDTKGGDKIEDLEVVCNENPKMPDDPTREGYKFVEWQLDGKKYDEENIKECKNITLEAKWEKIEETKSFTVTFDSKGGNTVKAITVKCGDKLPTLPTPTKDGYKFISWADKNGKVISKDAKLTCENVTLYANWKKKEETKSFTVTFDSKGGNTIKTIAVKCGDKLPTLPTPTKNGYKFISWADKNGKVISKDAKLTCENVTLYANWKKIEETKSFTVTFDSKGGNTIKAITVKCGDKLPTLPTPTRDGYNFISWIDKFDTPILEGALLSCEDVILYANWEKKEETKSFTITFDSKGGNTINALTIKCGDKLPSLPTPTRDGYKFISWIDKFDTPILEGALLSCENVTLYANWEKTEEKKEYTCSEGTLNVDKCIIEKEPDKGCFKELHYSDKKNKCYIYSYSNYYAPPYPRISCKPYKEYDTGVLFDDNQGHKGCVYGNLAPYPTDETKCQESGGTFATYLPHNHCYKYVILGTSQIDYKCPEGESYESGTSLSTDGSLEGCYIIKDLQLSCEKDYQLKGNKCIKTVNATLK